MRLLALSLLVACAATAPRPGLIEVTSRRSSRDVTTIRGWSRTRGAWVERRPTRPGEYRPIAPRALRPRPLLSRFAAYTAPEQALDDRAAATVVAMVIRPAWPRMVRVGGAGLR